MKTELEGELYRAVLSQISQSPPVLNLSKLSSNLRMGGDELVGLGVSPEALLRASREHYFSAFRSDCLPSNDDGSLSRQQFVDFGCRLSEALRIEANFHQVCNENGQRIEVSATVDSKLAEKNVMALLIDCFRRPSFGRQSLSVATQSAQIVYGLLSTVTKPGPDQAPHPLANVESIFDSVWKSSSVLSKDTSPSPDDSMTFEVERKYLLHRMPDLNDLHVTAVWQIEQGYIPGTSITERVRRATRDDSVKCTRTVKIGKGVKRIELEDEINDTLFAHLWLCTEGQRVTKRRYVVSHEEHDWELDEFVDRDLVLLEIELGHEDETVSMPDAFRAVLVREVTDDKNFTNWALSRMNTKTE